MEGNYVRLDPRIIQKGMYPESDLFFLHEGNPVLLCRGGALITTADMARLKKIADLDQPIYVDEKTGDSLKEQARFFLHADKVTEEKYEETASECSQFLDKVKETGEVNMHAVVRLVTLSEKVLDTMDVSFLLQFTHFMNGMDTTLQKHSTDVAILNGMMGKWMGLPTEDVRRLMLVGFLHDIGKLQVPPEILNKPGRLTPSEFEVIKKHPVFSWEMSKEAGITDEEMLYGIRSHHERLNASGYPDGLAGSDIVPFARVTAISDIYDAMVSERCYKPSSTPFEVLNEFYTDQFSNLDIAYVNTFMTKMVAELNGKYVILSDGRMGQIAYIEKTHVEEPIVDCHGTAVQTSKQDLKVVSVCGDLV